jgi:hypothetical protein
MAMPMRHGWTAGDLMLTYLMGLVMMIAMMTPAVIPTILLIATVERRRGQSSPNRRAGLALLGYLSVWAGACIIATLLQYGLHEAGIIYGAMSPVGAQVAGVTLILMGLFQLTPAKAACLRLCRSPVETIARYWRPAPGGSLRVGVRHGLYCLGCCWALMLIAVCHRGDESSLDCDPVGSRPRREAAAAGASAEQACRSCDPRLGRPSVAAPLSAAALARGAALRPIGHGLDGNRCPCR